MKHLKHFDYHINESTENIENNPNFKKWFEGSVIIDANNSPKIMYHGSLSSNITVFDLNSKPINRTGNFQGFYFLPLRNDALGYALNGRVYECFLSIKNPIYIGFKYNPLDGSYTKFKYVPSQKAIKYVYNKYKSQFNEDYIIRKIEDIKNYGYCSFMTGDDRRDIAIIDGYDGVIDGTEVCAFYPNQIKLADGSNMTFDKNNDDIRK